MQATWVNSKDQSKEGSTNVINVLITGTGIPVLRLIESGFTPYRQFFSHVHNGGRGGGTINVCLYVLC